MDINALVEQAKRAHQAGRLEDAASLYRQALAGLPGDPELLNLLGVLELQRNRFEQAIPHLQDALRMEPGNAVIHASLAFALEKSGDLALAERHLKEALRFEPGYAEGWNNLGNVLVGQDRLEEAAEAYRQAARLNPRYVDAQHNLGRAAQRLGRFAEAEAAYQQAMVLRTANVEVLRDLARLYAANDRPDQAVRAYQAALAQDEGDADTWYDLGILHLQRNDWAQAIEALQRAVAIRPEEATAQLALGRALRGDGRYEEALAALDIARQAMPGEGRVHHEIGYTLQKMTRYEEAAEAYRQAIALAPDMTEAHGNLGMVYCSLQEFDLAAAESREALRLNPDLAYPWGNLGNIAKALGNMDEAVSCYRRALALEPDDPSLRFALGFTLLCLGEFGEGWRYYASRPTMVDRQDVMIPTEPLPADLSGKRILLVLDQGIGDEIFFLRFAYELKRRGAFLMYRPFKKTASLVARLNIIDHLVGRDETPTQVDYAFSVGDLPLALGMREAGEAPPSVRIPILPAARDRVRQRLAKSGVGPWLGITWRAGVPKEEAIHVKKGKTLHKETPLEALAEIARDWPGQVLILQRLPKADEIEAFSRIAGRPVHDYTDLNDDLEQMLALMSEIDEYVGVSNTNMHLRAAVGKACRVLVPNPPEWRWMHRGRHSPWFPDFTVYREQAREGWDEAFRLLRQDMHDAWHDRSET